MAKKTLVSKRYWLNPKNHEDTGHVKAVVSLDSWTLEGEPLCDIEAEFALADCYRKVTLEFGCQTKRGAAQRLKKLDMIIDSLKQIRDAIDKHKGALRGR